MDDNEEVAKIMKNMGKKKKKSGKGMEGRIKHEVNLAEDYNEEEEGMEMDEEGNVKEVGTSKAQESRKDESLTKRRRGGDKEVEKAHGKGTKTKLRKRVKRNMVWKKNIVTLGAKGKKNAWRNFQTSIAKMGLVREHIYLEVVEGRDGRIQLEELSDLALVILSDNMREMGMNLLNNTCNNMLDNF